MAESFGFVDEIKVKVEQGVHGFVVNSEQGGGYDGDHKVELGSLMDSCHTGVVELNDSVDGYTFCCNLELVGKQLKSANLTEVCDRWVGCTAVFACERLPLVRVYLSDHQYTLTKLESRPNITHSR